MVKDRQILHNQYFPRTHALIQQLKKNVATNSDPCGDKHEGNSIDSYKNGTGRSLGRVLLLLISTGTGTQSVEVN